MDYQFFAARDEKGGRLYGLASTTGSGPGKLDRALKNYKANLTGNRPVPEAILQLLRATEDGKTIVLRQKEVAQLIAILLGEGAEFGRKQILESQ